MDEHAKIPRALIDKLFDLGVMGIEIPESYGGGGAPLLPRGARGRGAVARRSVDRRAGRRPEHAGHQRPAALGQRGPETPLPAAAGRVDGRRLRAVGGRLGQRRVCADDARRRARRRLRADRPQALDHQRQRSRPLHRLRQRESRGRLSRHHGVPRRARLRRVHRRQEGGQARHPREQHVRAAVRGLPRAARTTCSARSARATRSRSKR